MGCIAYGRTYLGTIFDDLWKSWSNPVFELTEVLTSKTINGIDEKTKEEIKAQACTNYNYLRVGAVDKCIVFSNPDHTLISHWMTYLFFVKHLCDSYNGASVPEPYATYNRVQIGTILNIRFGTHPSSQCYFESLWYHFARKCTGENGLTISGSFSITRNSNYSGLGFLSQFCSKVRQEQIKLIQPIKDLWIIKNKSVYRWKDYVSNSNIRKMVRGADLLLNEGYATLFKKKVLLTTLKAIVPKDLESIKLFTEQVLLGDSDSVIASIADTEFTQRLTKQHDLYLDYSQLNFLILGSVDFTLDN